MRFACAAGFHQRVWVGAGLAGEQSESRSLERFACAAGSHQRFWVGAGLAGEQRMNLGAWNDSPARQALTKGFGWEPALPAKSFEILANLKVFQ